jgi:septal ring factor EnvC (AmiA/AmiB activator)
VPDTPRAAIPWFLLVASVLLAGLLAYTLFVGYLPAKQRIARLERELSDLQAREAELQVRLAQSEQRQAVREQQLSSTAAERDAVTRRIEDLERQLSAARAKRP